jgi:DNA-binding transcriptional LysR family regulator
MKALHLTLRQLQIFRAVAEAGSTSAAADLIALSQSATSAAVNELERMLGLLLFDRVGKRLMLNDNGRALLPRALNVLDGAAGIERWAVESPAQIGALRLGASTTIGNYLLPEVLGEFRKELPESALVDWEVQVAIANTSAIVEQVCAFELDLGLIEGPCHARELIVEPWLEDEMVVVAGAQHPLVRQKTKGKSRLTLEDLSKESWLLREPGSGTREIVDQLLIPHLHHLRAGIEFGNSEAIKRAAASGLGLTCLSRCVVQDLLDSGALVAPSTELPRLRRQFYLVVHQGKQRSRGLDLLIEHLRNAARQ